MPGKGVQATFPSNPLLIKVSVFPITSFTFPALFVTLKHIHIAPTKGGVYLNKECHQLLAERNWELKSKLAKQHNRKCEGQEDRASSLSLHRQQSATALLTSENWSSSSSEAMTFKPLQPLYRTRSQRDYSPTSQRSTSLFLPTLRCVFKSSFGVLRLLIFCFYKEDNLLSTL